MSKVKIKKGKSGTGSVFSRMSRMERVLFLVPTILLVAVVIWFLLFSGLFGASLSRSDREALFTTEGQWVNFEDYGIDVWAPKDIPEEELSEDAASYQKVFVTRDKGKFPEIAYGIILAPDVDNRTFDINNDPGGVLDVTTPLLNEAFGNMINGAYPSLSVDVDVITLESGNTVLEGSGEASVTLVYQDPKDETNVWSEETTTNLYYMVVLFEGRPVIIWGTWDYSTYEGDVRTKAFVADGATSVMQASGQDLVVPVQTELPVSTNNVIEGSTSTWNEETQQWIDDETGEVVDLPDPDDPYWDEANKQAEAAGDVTTATEIGQVPVISEEE